jgi:tetratricopeptide (TPR) repeat protein
MELESTRVPEEIMSKKKRQTKQRRPAPTARRRQGSTTKNYRTAQYVEYIFTAEVGVLQAATLLPELTDGEVLNALRKLVAQIDAGGLPRFREQPTDTDGMIVWLIVQGWEDLFRRKSRLSTPDMVGVLNTVIESAQTHVRNPRGRGYLKYLEQFMKRAGVSIKVKPASEFEGEGAEEDLVYDFDRMSLAELGKLFVKEPDVLGLDDAFENRANAQIVAGQADEVIALCRPLLKQTDEPYVRAILHTVLGTAYRHVGDLEQAVETLQAAQSPEMTYEPALDELAETYRKMGQYEQAIQTWQRCLEGFPRREGWFFHQKIADTYREIGDLAGEETALRNLVEASKRGGCLFLGWGARDSIAALAQLADCLRRQGRESEWRPLVARIRRTRLHIRGDHFEDWAYWVREWMLIDEQDVPLGRLEDLDGQEPGPVHWVPVLRAVLYDQIGRPDDAAPFWRRVRREIAGKPYAWVLTHTRNILGDLLPPSSQLFDILNLEQAVKQ